MKKQREDKWNPHNFPNHCFVVIQTAVYRITLPGESE